MTQNGPFKPCDVRGTYPDEVNESLFRALGRALPRLYPDAGPVVLGGDARLSSPALLAALADGLGPAAAGATVLQPFPTPGLYYVGTASGAALTLIVTASHNPARYNGLKLLARGEAPTEDEMCRLAEATARERRDGGCIPSSAVISADAAAWGGRYVDHLLQRAPARRGLRVVVDPGNGCLCGMAATALRRAGHRVTEIHGVMDGRFPDRGPDPTAPGALDGLAAAVRAGAADVGIAFDGDGDRVVFVDGDGTPAAADAIAALLARQALSVSGDTVVLDVRASRLLAGWLQGQGARIVWSRPGHAFLRSELRRRQAAFGGEISGHYFFAELGGDDGLFAALRLLALVADEGPLADLVASLPRPMVLREFRLPYRLPPGPVLAAIEAGCRPLHVERFGSGLSMDMGDAWVVARLSLTEPLIALRCEAASLERLRSLADCIEAAIGRFGLSIGAALVVDPVWGSE
ncbi:MAG: phosphohexomutase domain-containing protein [Anaerolineae bacterium]